MTLPHQKRIRGTIPFVEQAARNLRNRLTPAEAFLWQALKNKQLEGLRFRCQHPVGRFILDFYCPSCKLVVEVDGSFHNGREEYDLERTKILESYGYFVVRFTNDEVINELERVLSTIATIAKDRLAP